VRARLHTRPEFEVVYLLLSARGRISKGASIGPEVALAAASPAAFRSRQLAGSRRAGEAGTTQTFDSFRKRIRNPTPNVTCPMRSFVGQPCLWDPGGLARNDWQRDSLGLAGRGRAPPPSPGGIALSQPRPALTAAGASESVPDSMIQVPGGNILLRPTALQETSVPSAGHEVNVPDFWIDRTEVTTGEYLLARRPRRVPGLRGIATPAKDRDASSTLSTA